MKTSKIKAPILIPLTIAIFLLVGAFAYSSFNAQYAEHEIGIAEQVQTAYAVLETQIRADAASMSAAIEVLARNPELQSAWLARDRKTLLALSSDIATRLWGEHRVTHFYFHDANRVNFLRVHDPERLGGPIERETLKTAVDYSQPYHGLEIGESGTLTLRTVHPWRIGGKITGYIELGEEIVQIAEKLSDTLGIDLFVLIDKKFLDRAKWERGMRRLGRNPDWDRAASAVVVTGTLPEALEGLAGVIEDEGSARPGLSPPGAAVRNRPEISSFPHTPQRRQRKSGGPHCTSSRRDPLLLRAEQIFLRLRGGRPFHRSGVVRPFLLYPEPRGRPTG